MFLICHAITQEVNNVGGQFFTCEQDQHKVINIYSIWNQGTLDTRKAFLKVLFLWNILWLTKWIMLFRERKK